MVLCATRISSRDISQKLLRLQKNTTYHSTMAAPEGVLNWYKDIHQAFEECGIGRAAWSYKEMDFGIIGEHYEPVYDELVKNL